MTRGGLRPAGDVFVIAGSCGMAIWGDRRTGGPGAGALVFSGRTRWAVSTGGAVVAVVVVWCSSLAGEGTDAYVLAHGLGALPFLAVGLACVGRTLRVCPPEYRVFWQRWFAATVLGLGAAAAATAAVVFDTQAFLVVDMALLVAAVPFWLSAVLHMLRAQAGRRSPSIDVVDGVTALAVLGAPGVLLVAEPLARTTDLVYALPFALAAVLAPAGMYLSLVNLSRIPAGDRAAQGIGVVLGGVATVNLTMQLARVLGGLDLALPVFVAVHVTNMALFLVVPLWAHRRATSRLAQLPPERQVRHSNPMPYVSAVVLPVVAVYVFVTRSDRSWGVAFFSVVVLTVVVLNAVRYTAMSRETRRLYAGLTRMAEERRRLLASMVRALEDDHHRMAAELHSQAVGSLATLGSMIQTAYVALPTDIALTVRETITHLQGDLSDRAEELRQLMVAMRPPTVGRHRTGPAPGTEGAAGSDDPGGPDGPGDTALAAALRAHASELYGDQAASTVSVHVDPALHLDWTTMTIVYRIAQEALLNAARHAMAGSVAVAVTGHDGGVAVEVADDGIGFEPGTTRSGSGLATIELFTELGRGRLAVRSAPGQGTVVRSVLGARSGDGPGRRDQRRHLRLIPAVDRSPATGAPDAPSDPPG